MAGDLRLVLKVKVNPLFYVAILLYILIGGLSGYLLALFAVLIHELSHYAVARIAGAKCLTITLMPYGAMMQAEGELPHFGAILIAGPLSNLIVASFALSACWIFPELYGYLKVFIAANAMIATVNLLPAYPLDGGRLARLIFSGKKVKIATALLTPIVGVIMIVLFGVLKRVTCLVFGVFMVFYFIGISIGKRNRCTLRDPLFALAKTDEEGRLLRAIVYDGKRKVCSLTPCEINRLCLKYPSEVTIGEALAGEKCRSGYK